MLKTCAPFQRNSIVSLSIFSRFIFSKTDSEPQTLRIASKTLFCKPCGIHFIGISETHVTEPVPLAFLRPHRRLDLSMEKLIQVFDKCVNARVVEAEHPHGVAVTLRAPRSSNVLATWKEQDMNIPAIAACRSTARCGRDRVVGPPSLPCARGARSLPVGIRCAAWTGVAQDMLLPRALRLLGFRHLPTGQHVFLAIIRCIRGGQNARLARSRPCRVILGTVRPHGAPGYLVGSAGVAGRVHPAGAPRRSRLGLSLCTGCMCRHA